MAYYFSYDVSIPNYLEEENYYKKEELHCTLAYSKNDFSNNQLLSLSSLNIELEEKCIVTKIDIFNKHLVLLIDNPNLMNTNKDILEKFSIVEDHSERKMHVSIRKNLGAEALNLKLIEEKYVGTEIYLHTPKLIIKGLNGGDDTVINLENYLKSTSLKIKP